MVEELQTINLAFRGLSDDPDGDGNEDGGTIPEEEDLEPDSQLEELGGSGGEEGAGSY
jgi:hypothetical protein